jgi:hypothetical protein
MRRVRPARLAGVLITVQRSSAGVVHARLVDGVQHHVQAHPETEGR